MKKLINISLTYAVFAMIGGVFYREFTKFNGFTQVTALGKVHTHLFLLGMFMFLITALFTAHLPVMQQKSFKAFLIVYNIGVPLSAVMMVVRGIVQVLNISLSSAGSAAISGIAGIAHPCVKDFLSDEASGATVVYREGIYVGYRYFDAFGIKAQYPFGYGLSYTSFAYSDYQLALQAETVHVYLTVQNIGTKFSGREIVQIYTQQPQKNVPKAKKILTGFAKTKVLAPQEKQQLCITFPLEYLASYSELQAAFILDDGTYTILAGSCSEQLQTVGVLVLDAPCLTHQLKNVFSSHKKMDLVSPNPETPNIPCASNTIYINHENIACRKISYQPNADAPQTCLQSLTDKQLVSLVKGFSCNEMTGVVGAGVEIVPGAAGETTNLIEGLPSLVMADGPCGIRIVQHFQVDAQGQILKNTAMAALENGLFDAQNDCATAEKDYYQYCTSFPIGTLLAQTWDEALLTEIGMAVSAEMVRYGIALWLAPGMNIHRNPLCGRNFEYYSEDPLLSGKIAAAQVCGVQKNTHTGAVIKHFACNNQETGRLGGNSVVSEQALREIYLKGFEIVVKEQKPAAIMTSYNAINGVHTANSYALCTDVLRNEWSFEGIVMTDWGTTELGADTVACILAGNDLIMPGSLNDESLLMQALLNGSLPRKALLRCAQRVRNCIRSFL